MMIINAIHPLRIAIRRRYNCTTIAVPVTLQPSPALRRSAAVTIIQATARARGARLTHLRLSTAVAIVQAATRARRARLAHRRAAALAVQSAARGRFVRRSLLPAEQLCAEIAEATRRHVLPGGRRFTPADLYLHHTAGRTSNWAS